MKKILFILLIFSASSFGGYGLVPSQHKGYSSAVMYDLPQRINLNWSRSFYPSHSEEVKEKIKYALNDAVHWLNWYLGIEAFKFRVYDNPNYDPHNPTDHYVHLIYKPQKIISKNGKEMAGLCSSKENYQVMWWNKIPHKRINEIIDSKIEIFIRLTDDNYDYWQAVLRHELLHSIGFSHVPTGLMSENIFWKESDWDFIESKQLRAWEKETGFLLNIGKGEREDPELLMLY